MISCPDCGNVMYVLDIWTKQCPKCKLVYSTEPDGDVPKKPPVSVWFVQGGRA